MSYELDRFNTAVVSAAIAVSTLGIAVVAVIANDHSNDSRNECAALVAPLMAAGDFSASEVEKVTNEVCRG